MFGLRPRKPLTRKQGAWAIAQHLLMPTDWPAGLLHGLRLAPALTAVPVTARSAAPLGSAPALRIAFAADFHAGPTTHDTQLDRAVAAIVDWQPDLILLGGDFVGHRPRDARRLIPRLAGLRAPLGVLAVLGNHDNNTDPTLVAEVLAESGVRLLVNEAVTLPAPFERTRVIGLDDHTSGTPDITSVQPDETRTSILLAHQPSALLDVAPLHIDLALAGHTHGGQIVLPGGYAPITPGGPLSRRYLAGEYVLTGGGTLVVSRGVGTSSVPMRWNAPADVLLITLHGG